MNPYGISPHLMQPQSLRRQGWRNHAACRDTDPGLFFPKFGGSAQKAKAVCAGCPVAAACLDYALASGQQFGVWAGLDERERQGMNRPAARSAFCGKGLHLRTEKNTYVSPTTGRRYCKACKQTREAIAA